MFLKFLKFTTSLDYKTEIFDGDSYRILIFRVKDFLDVSHSYYNSQNEYYKMQKTKDFFQDLQQNLFVKCFTDDCFKSLVTVPKLEVYKCKKSKCWVTRILLLERLFDYISDSSNMLVSAARLIASFARRPSMAFTTRNWLKSLGFCCMSLRSPLGSVQASFKHRFCLFQ